MTNPFDLAVFHAINGADQPWLDAVFLLFSSPIAGIACGVALATWLTIRHRPMIWRAAISGTVALVLSDTIGARVVKPWVGRVRPCYALAPDSVRVLEHAANVGSMPSLHAANTFAIAFVVTMIDRRLAAVVYPVAIVVGISRIYVGVHWPTDVLVGAAWGSLAGLVGWFLTAQGMRSLGRMRKEPSSENT